jgi:acyl carrier protein
MSQNSIDLLLNQAHDMLLSIMGCSEEDLATATSLQDLNLDSVQFSALAMKVEAVLGKALSHDEMTDLLTLEGPIISNLAQFMSAIQSSHS